MKAEFQKIKSVNDKLALFLFKEEAIIYSNLSNNLYLLNAQGVYAWLLYEEGLAKEEVLALCIENKIAAKQEISSSEKAALSLLVDELNNLFNSAIIPNEQSIDEELWLNEIQFTKKHNDSFYNAVPYKILDSVFYFSCTNTQIENLIQPILEQFKMNDIEASAENKNTKTFYIQIHEAEDKLYRISINDYLFPWKIPPQRLLSLLLDRLRKLAFTYSAYFLGAHAAVLSKGNTCLMLPAISYSGKSTLSAFLVSKGYQYLSDEMAVLDENFKARAVPLGLGLKSGSWELTSLLLN